MSRYLTTADKLYIVPMTRTWNGKKFADLVVSKTPEGRKDVPIFYSPPESVRKEDEKEKGMFLFSISQKKIFESHLLHNLCRYVCSV